jgi:hypothetical protein
MTRIDLAKQDKKQAALTRILLNIQGGIIGCHQFSETKKSIPGLDYEKKPYTFENARLFNDFLKISAYSKKNHWILSLM